MKIFNVKNQYTLLNYILLWLTWSFLVFQGEKSFFLMPGEKLEKGIQNVYILGEDEGLILKANESFMDGVSFFYL